MLPVTALAANSVESGTCGNNLIWTIDSNETLIISGTGSMTDYDYYSKLPPWHDKDIACVIVEDGITHIGTYAFYGSNASKITLPTGVREIPEGAFYGNINLKHITIPDGVTKIDGRAFFYCSLESISLPKTLKSIANQAFYLTPLNDVYYAGTEEEWNNIFIGSQGGYNDSLTSATIHFNSSGPNDTIGSDDTDATSEHVYFLTGYDETSRELMFGSNNMLSPDTYIVTNNFDMSNIDQLLGKYVFVTAEQAEDNVLQYTVTDVQPVESAIGEVSATGEHSLTIDGTEHPVSENLIVGIWEGEEVLYHVYNGTIVGATLLEKKTGTLEAWDSTTGQVTIDGTVYPTNYLSDLAESIDQLIGKKVEFAVAATSSYNPVLKLSFCPGFYFSTNAVTSCVEAGTTFDLYVGYYCEDGSLDFRSKDFISVVSNENVIDATPDGWDDTYGQHYTITARKAGGATLTVTNPQNSDAASLDLYVIEKETGYSFDNVPKLMYEDGKTTNFYNYNGMVVDEFAYTPHKDENGAIDYYTVTMTVYNSLDLYGAVTAFDAEGNPQGFCIIDKKEALPSDFVNTVKELILETGDLFYLIGNSHYYSGESITKKTEISIEVPVGGYIEISNSIYSDIALCANVISLVIDGLSKAKDIVDDTADFDGLIAAKPAIISEIISEDYIGKKLTDVFKDAAINELKNVNWNYNNYGECLQAFLDRLSESGIDLMESISKKIVSVTGIASITESVVMKIVPTGNLINFLYDLMGIGDQVVAWVTFQKSADFSTGIYIYAPSVGNSYNSNGISIIPATAVESNVVIHSYLVVDPYEVIITNSTFPNEQTYLEHSYETYNITMYKDGQEVQPDSIVTVKIPLSGTFQSLDIAKIKVYRINDDSTVTDMSATVIDGYAVFTTDHFSYYAVVYEGEITPPISEIYTITFNANGGAVSVATMTTGTDGKLSSLPTPTRSGYTFNGWYTAASGGDKITTNTVFSADTTVYAQWTHTGSGSSNNGSSGNGNNSGSSSYTVSVPSTIGGQISVTPSNANKGTTVTFTATPDQGYGLSNLTVTDVNGNELALTDDGNGKYTFTMPGSAVTISAVFAPEQLSNPFTDIKERDWFYNEVLYAYAHGLMEGIGNNLFAPKAVTSRAQLVTVLYRLEGAPAVTNRDAFTDVADSAWYCDAVAWAAANGIVDGYGNGKFGPDDPITREQMAAILYRYAAYKGYDTAANVDLSSYTDAGEIASWAVASLSWANAAGLITGRSAAALAPTGTATRAEVAAILMRFCENVVI